MTNKTTGIERIAAERQRQFEEEGRTDWSDEDHVCEELATAAALYAMPRHIRYDLPIRPSGVPAMWPWDASWWKPGDRIRELEKAGALIAAEIDRLIAARREGAE